MQGAGRLPTHGKARLRLGAAGAVTTIKYNQKTDGRIEGKHFKINQPVLIIMRNTNHLSLEVMIEMQII